MFAVFAGSTSSVGVLNRQSGIVLSCDDEFITLPSPWGAEKSHPLDYGTGTIMSIISKAAGEDPLPLLLDDLLDSPLQSCLRIHTDAVHCKHRSCVQKRVVAQQHIHRPLGGARGEADLQTWGTEERQGLIPLEDAVHLGAVAGMRKTLLDDFLAAPHVEICLSGTTIRSYVQIYATEYRKQSSATATSSVGPRIIIVDPIALGPIKSIVSLILMITAPSNRRMEPWRRVLDR